MLTLGLSRSIDEFLCANRSVDSLLRTACCLLCRGDSKFELLANNRVCDAGV